MKVLIANRVFGGFEVEVRKEENVKRDLTELQIHDRSIPVRFRALVDASIEHAQCRFVLSADQFLPGREHGRFSNAIYRELFTERLLELAGDPVEPASVFAEQNPGQPLDRRPALVARIPR